MNLLQTFKISVPFSSKVFRSDCTGMVRGKKIAGADEGLLRNFWRSGRKDLYDSTDIDHIIWVKAENNTINYNNMHT